MVPLPVPASGPPPPHPRLLLLPASSSSSAASAATLPAPGAALSPPPRKRQRLAHLSPEEKALRRKLKNRVAAQSARDRKKARMGELERQAVELEAENQKLLAENQALRERTQSLARENRELRLRLGLPALEVAAPPAAAAAAGGGAAPAAVALKVEMLEEEEGEQPKKGSTIGATAGSAESAALRLRVPLQQGQAQQPLASVVVASAWIQTTLIIQILSLTSSWAFWTAWIQICSCTMEEVQNQPVWRSCTKKRVEKQIPYQPPPVPLWGPQHPSWRPLMN